MNIALNTDPTLYVIWLKSTSVLAAYSNKSQLSRLSGVSASLSPSLSFFMALAVLAVVPSLSHLLAVRVHFPSWPTPS